MLKQGLTVFQNSFIYQTDEFAIKGEECDPKKGECKKSHQSCRDEDGDGYWHWLLTLTLNMWGFTLKFIFISFLANSTLHLDFLQKT